MKVLGIDPGPTSCGFALLEVSGGLARHIACGAMSGLDLAVEIRDARQKPDLIAIERGAGAHAGIARDRGVQAALSIARHGGHAQEIGGFLRGVAWSLGIEVVELEATQARRAVVGGTGSTDDATIARAVARLVVGWPTPSLRAGERAGQRAGGNAHERDAAVVAIAAGRGVRAPVRPEAPRSPKSSKRAQIVSRSLRAKMAQMRKKSEGGKGAKPPAGPSRARARRERSTAEQVRARVEHIEMLMRRGTFLPETARAIEAELCAEWGITVAAFRKLSAEASRRVRSGWRKPKAVRNDCLAKLQRAYFVADGQGDAKGMTAAVLATAKIAGVEAPQKVALTTAAGEDLPAPFLAALDHPACSAFLLLKGRPPTEEEAAELRAGTRRPDDP